MQRTILFFVLATAPFVGTAGADEPAKPESTASGVLRITADPDSGLAEDRLVIALVSTKSLLKEAVSNVSKEAPSEVSDVASVKWTKWTQDEGITLMVTSYSPLVPADKLLEAITNSLSDRLRDLDVGHRLDKARADRLSKEVAQIKRHLETEYSEFAKLAAIHGVSTDAELSAQKQVRLEAELQSLKVQSQGLRARQKILEHQVAELGEKVAEGAGADPVVLKELMKSVDARKKVVGYRQAAVFKGASEAEVSEARADLEEAKDELAKAEIELAKYRRAAADAAGGGRIEELKRRLDDTAIELAENSARGDAVQKQLDQVRTLSGSLEIKRLDVERLKQDYRDASDELSNLRRKLGLYFPPEVTLVPLQ